MMSPFHLFFHRLFIQSKERVYRMQRIFREQKVNLLKNGYSAYAESTELIRLIKRDILRNALNVHYDETPIGCWFIPLTPQDKHETSYNK